MRSKTLGKNIFDVEVTNLDKHGIWILLRGEEFFLPFTEFPWFTKATIQEILNIELLHNDHLYWPDLDIDLTADSLRNPDKYPLVWKE